MSPVPFFAVSSHVLPHVTRLNESFLADGANVVPLPSMGGCVSLQVGLLHECLSTVGANKLLFALVIPKMVLETQKLCPKSMCFSKEVYLIHRVGSELLVTLGTTVALFSSVQSYVGFKICLLRESLSTESAQEGLFHLHMFIHLCI